MIRKCFGGKQKRREQKKVILIKKSVKRVFLGIMGRKDGVCVGRCMCSHNHGEKR